MKFALTDQAGIYIRAYRNHRDDLIAMAHRFWRAGNREDADISIRTARYWNTQAIKIITGRRQIL